MQSSEQNRKDMVEIEAAMEAWARAFEAENPGSVLDLYADDAVLWGTLSPVRRDTPEGIREYFKGAFSFTERRVTFHDPLIRIYGDAAVNTGSYTFSWVKDGAKQIIPARYSLTYVKREGQWRIIDHHSSMMPESG